MGFFRPDDLEELQYVFSELTQDVTIGVSPGDEELFEFASEMARTAEGRIRVVHASADPFAELVGLSSYLDLSSETSRGRLQFYGHPQGYEITLLIMVLADLGDISPDPALVTPTTAQVLGTLDRDIHIQVFSTPG